MANEPSLSELTSINPDPGAAPPIIDGTNIVNTLNQNARFHAENVWNKYTTFLKNKKDLFADIGAIQDLDTLAQDGDVLKKQAGDILKQLSENPSIVYGGKGLDELQGKISQFKQDAMASKQANFDYKTNKMFLDRNPELYTDENKSAIEGELKKPLNSRNPVLLNMPTILDTKTAFEGLVKSNTHDYTSPVEIDGVPYIESGKELNPIAVENAWGLITKGGQTDKFGHDLLGAVKYNYSKLPEREKQNYETLSKEAKEGGDLSASPEHMYWKDHGSKYLNAYFPDGSYTKTKEGNLRFAKNLTKDPYYLAEKQLAEKTANDKAELSLKWANYGLDKRKLDEADTEDLGSADAVLNEATSILNNATPQRVVSKDGKSERTILRISDPTLLQTFGNVDKDGKVTNVPDAVNYDPVTNQPVLLYFSARDKSKNKTENVLYEREIPLDQRTWLKHITKRSFPNKDIGKINTLLEGLLSKNNNSLYGISQKNKNTATPQAQAVTYKIGNTTITEDQLRKGAEKYKMSLQEYKKQVGL